MSKIQTKLGEAYRVMPNFISNKEVNELRTKFLESSKNIGILPDDGVVYGAKGIHQFPLAAIILCNKLQEVANILDEPCLPSYAYTRSYGHLGELREHTDRDSCEISITVHLGGDKDWTFLIESIDKTVHSINLNPGDAIIFDGINFTHSRQGPYSGISYEQLFLHYVYANGDFVNHMFEPPGGIIY